MIPDPCVLPHFYYMNLFFFFFNDTATTEIYTLSLHDALPISQLNSSPSSLRRGMMCRWKWKTDCPAPSPFACIRLMPSGWTAALTALATLAAVRAVAAKSSGTISNTFGACAFGITKACPSWTGLMSMKASVSASSNSLKHGISPATILQKMQLGSEAIIITPISQYLRLSQERQKRMAFAGPSVFRCRSSYPTISPRVGETAGEWPRSLRPGDDGADGQTA